ncbi:glycosyltransferase family 2 protein [Myceligenerans xiligouense]|nr:glycosyltransferase family 2 protein [Myceligenerans xiligouense]
MLSEKSTGTSVGARRKALPDPLSAVTSRLTLTVLIPAHNEAHTIGATLDALTEQTRAPERVVVVADNCTDTTTQIAARYPVDVHETRANTDRKAGALNQALALVDTDVVMVLDADTRIAATFVEQGMGMLGTDPGLGAVGGVFQGETPHGYLQHCQANEYERYGVQIGTTGRVAVLTGTAALIRTGALLDVMASRSSRLPGRFGDAYDRDAITEDSELTLALKHLGWRLASPTTMTCTTELMPTWGDLHRQRLRWYKGMLDNLSAYGLTRVTARYIGQQIMLAIGTLMMGLYLTMTAWLIVTGAFGISLPWLAIGVIFLAERLVTAWGAGTRGRVLAALMLPELVYDVALQAAFVHAVVRSLTGRTITWNHVSHLSERA